MAVLGDGECFRKVFGYENVCFRAHAARRHRWVSGADLFIEHVEQSAAFTRFRVLFGIEHGFYGSVLLAASLFCLLAGRFLLLGGRHVGVDLVFHAEPEESEHVMHIGRHVVTKD